MAGFGAFGKMPALGDFFRINAAPDFVDPWDAWLQQGILSMRDAMGARWSPCYLSAPIWRFSLSPGLAGPAAAMGVLMPSVDRVGRQFPLTLMSSGGGAGALLRCHLRFDETFAQLEDIALDMLEDDASRECLAERLAALEVPEIVRPELSANLQRLPGAVALSLAERGDADAAVEPAVDLAETLLMDGFRRPSLWSADLNGTRRYLMAEGLPAGSSLAALFDPGGAVWMTKTEGALT
ncbi:MAG: type VI secretion system-associated protein TagF [Rhodobacteraceae bacterium]|nr:type VI secretion system-associated protein TagF [Paracoccaceae bacterium]